MFLVFTYTETIVTGWEDVSVGRKSCVACVHSVGDPHHQEPVKGSGGVLPRTRQHKTQIKENIQSMQRSGERSGGIIKQPFWQTAMQSVREGF